MAESLALSADLGDKVSIAACLMDLAGVAERGGRAELAARLLGAAATVRHELGRRFQPHERAAHDRIVATARAALGAARYASAWERGAALPLGDVIGEATAAWSPPPGDPAGLSPRELQVLCLLAEGSSDKAIADALFVSQRTASSHVAAIFRKLDVTSRAAAAAYAVRHGFA